MTGGRQGTNLARAGCRSWRPLWGKHVQCWCRALVPGGVYIPCCGRWATRRGMDGPSEDRVEQRDEKRW